MEYITLHANQAAYDAVKDSLPTPQVALIQDSMTVNYNPQDPSGGHEYVEIGGIKWATMNVGATGVTDYGLYFQWGDTQGYTAAQVGSGEGQKYFAWKDYKYGNGTSYPSMTKYNSTDGKTVLDASDDAVQAAWGGNWRMPTVSEFIALGEAVTSAWTADYQGSGVAGVVLTSNADGATLFFPACGLAIWGSVDGVDEGLYWSSSLNGDYGDNNAYCLNFIDNDLIWQGNAPRYSGYPVRGVLAEN